MMHGMSISYFCLVASSLARVSFGDTLEAKLPHPAIVGLLDRNDVAVDAHLLANARKRRPERKTVRSRRPGTARQASQDQASQGNAELRG